MIQSQVLGGYISNLPRLPAGLVLFLIVYFDIISNLLKVFKSGTRNSSVCFTQIHCFFFGLFCFRICHMFVLISEIFERKLRILYPFISKYLNLHFLKSRTFSYQTKLELSKSRNLIMINKSIYSIFTFPQLF